MSYLLHCIVERGVAEQEPAALPRNFSVVPGDGVAAVVSREEPAAQPGVTALLAYERVVQSLHERQTVLPLRYGCWLESEAEIVRLLNERRPEYEALLIRLGGMTEMGIRLLLPARPVASFPLSTGASYLAALRRRYSAGKTLTIEEDEQAGRIVSPLASLVVDQRREAAPSRQGCMISLALLVPKTSVEEFRRQTRAIACRDGAKLLLTGPWPPYSFVRPVD
jgi:hypothetical protein